MQRYRVQWATGRVGQRALRAVLDRDVFELVGLYAFSPDKVVQDAGTVAGIAPVGLLATDEVDTLIGTAPDCVLYTPRQIDYAQVERFLPAAAQQIIGGIVQMSGQTCLCGARVIAAAGVYDELVQLISTMLPFINVGDPLEKDTMMGPVVSEPAAARIIEVIERARQHSRLIAGGDRLGGDHAAGYFIPPTVFVDVDSDVEIAQQEIFGPVLSIMRCSDTDDGVRLANSTAYGLAGYLWSNDLATTHLVVADLEVGNVWVNGFFGMPPAMPFGGVKSSGFGRIGGRDGIREFTRPKNVWLAM